MAAVDYRMVLEQNEYRQCKVLGVKALFHRYVDDVKILFKNNVVTPQHVADGLIDKHRKLIEELNIIPRGFDVEKVSATLALVEFEDGTVQKVDPTDVKFLDTKEKMAGFDWGE